MLFVKTQNISRDRGRDDEFINVYNYIVMAVRIGGITLPEQKHISIALTAVYGIGRSRGETMLQELKIASNTKTRDLTSTEEQKIRDYIDVHFKIEGELKREAAMNIRRLKDIGTYRGMRHTRRLPARGQRSKTNSRTVRGNIRRTAGSGKRKTEKT